MDFSTSELLSAEETFVVHNIIFFMNLNRYFEWEPVAAHAQYLVHTANFGFNAFRQEQQKNISRKKFSPCPTKFVPARAVLSPELLLTRFSCPAAMRMGYFIE
jgi:hypothetical protein